MRALKQALSALLAVTFVSGGARAADNFQVVKQRVVEENLRRETTYEQTLKLCKEDWRSYAWIAEQAWSESYSIMMLDLRAMSRFYAKRGIPPEVSALMDSEAFGLALRDCGRDAETIQRMYRADFAGKAAGVISGMAAWRALIWFAPILFARFAFFGRFGSDAQKGIAVVGLAFAVNAAHQLRQAFANRDHNQADAKQKVDAIKRELDQSAAAFNESLMAEIRADLAATESALQSPNLPDESRRALVARAGRARELLSTK